jgi:hypothetical protein
MWLPSLFQKAVIELPQREIIAYIVVVVINFS